MEVTKLCINCVNPSCAVVDIPQQQQQMVGQRPAQGHLGGQSSSAECTVHSDRGGNLSGALQSLPDHPVLSR